MSLLAIDPGTDESAYVCLELSVPAPSLITFGKVPNARLRNMIGNELLATHCVIERIAGYGMPVGAEVFETVHWAARFLERWVTTFGDEPSRIVRREVKLTICQSPKANDASIRQAIIDRYGPGKEKAIGKKKTPGPLYGIASDVWQALAVGLTWIDRPDLR